jgi:[ribosomal protein S5]-alanine N-acetyltransferase
MAYFLSSPRLGFRHWTATDLPLAESLWMDAGVMTHMGGPMTAEQAKARLELECTRQAALGISYWPIFHLIRGEHVGCAGLRPFHDEPRVYELGVHIAPKFWGGRYGEEAARTVIEYAFGTVGALELTAGHGPENMNSKDLLERLGFAFSHEEPWGAQNRMHPFYRLKPEQWLAKKAQSMNVMPA